jgi:hypothetical protein
MICVCIFIDHISYIRFSREVPVESFTVNSCAIVEFALQGIPSIGFLLCGRIYGYAIGTWNNHESNSIPN